MWRQAQQARLLRWLHILFFLRERIFITCACKLLQLRAPLQHMHTWQASACAQVRNGATLGGNIVAAHPISDINALLMAAGGRYTLVSRSSGRRTVAPEDFVTGRGCAARPASMPASTLSAVHDEGRPPAGPAA